MAGKMYTIPEAARLLGVAPVTLYSAQRRGVLPRTPHPEAPHHRTLYAISEDDLTRYSRDHLGRVGRRPFYRTQRTA